MINKETYMLTYYEQLPQEIAKLRNTVRALSNDKNKKEIGDLIKELEWFERIIAEGEWTNFQLQTSSEAKLKLIAKLLLIMKKWNNEGILEPQGINNTIDFIISKITE